MSSQEDSMKDFFGNKPYKNKLSTSKTPKSSELGTLACKSIEGVKEEANTNTDLYKTNSLLNIIVEQLNQLANILSEIKATQPSISGKHFSTSQTAVTVATATKPESPDTIAGTTGYDRIKVAETLNRISPKISVINDGNVNLYVIISTDGETWSADENPILVGEAREFFNVYELRIRSPTAGDLTTLQGGIYRITEYQYSLAYTSTTTFNRTSLLIQSLQNIALTAVGQQLPNIVVPNGFSLVVRATQGNTGSVYIATTAAALNVATTRNTLSAGDAVELYITNANIVYVGASVINQNVDLVVEQ